MVNYVEGDKVETNWQHVEPEKLGNSRTMNDLDTYLGHVQGNKRALLRELLLQNRAVFGDHPTVTNVTTYDLDLTGHAPIRSHPYRVSPDKRELIRREVDYMLTRGIVEKACSSWSSPVVLVRKSDGSQRLCVDFRKINAITPNLSYPLPRLDDLIERVGTASFIVTLDLLKGYWQLPLSERTKKIATFVTPDGSFSFTTLPFGLKQAPLIFQSMMDQLVEGIPGCEVYLDDIILFADEWGELLEKLREFLGRLRRANLTVNLEKSRFLCPTVQYLGYIVGQGQIRPVPQKVEAIKTFPGPRDKKALMRFLGMIGFYRRFCKDFAKIATPLTSMLKKKEQFCWTKERGEAFDRLKHQLVSAPVLLAPTFGARSELYVDASGSGMGAVLHQFDGEQSSRPVGFYSQKFNKHEVNYSIVEKEALAIISALKHFVTILSPRMPLQVYTDHNLLTFLERMKNTNQKLMRWALVLQEYNLKICHIKGSMNKVADALSRVDWSDPDGEKNQCMMG